MKLLLYKYSTESDFSFGWDAFRNYIDSNKKILTADSVLKGIEVISFIVNNKNELSVYRNHSPDKSSTSVDNNPKGKKKKTANKYII